MKINHRYKIYFKLMSKHIPYTYVQVIYCIYFADGIFLNDSLVILFTKKSEPSI